MNVITIELCKEDRERLDRLAAALNSVGTPFGAEAPERPQERPAETPKETPAPEPKPAEAKESPATAATLSDIQRKVVELSAAGKKAQVRDIVKAVAERVSQIPEDKVAEVWEKLTALEAE